jgi:hypothetical protein
MNDGAKQAYLDKMTAQLREWGAKVEVVKARIAMGTADMRVTYHNQIEKWNESEPMLKRKLEELRSAGIEGFEALKSGAQNTWDDMNLLVETLEDKQNEIKK